MTDQSITVPASGWSPAHYTVEASEIAGMKISKYGRCIYLKLYARDRRRFTINSHWLPEPEDIATIVNWVMERTGIAMDQSRGKWRYPD